MLTPVQWEIWARLMLAPLLTTNPWMQFWLTAALQAEEHRLASKQGSLK